MKGTQMHEVKITLTRTGNRFNKIKPKVASLSHVFTNAEEQIFLLVKYATYSF